MVRLISDALVRLSADDWGSKNTPPPSTFPSRTNFAIIHIPPYCTTLYPARTLPERKAKKLKKWKSMTKKLMSQIKKAKKSSSKRSYNRRTPEQRAEEAALYRARVCEHKTSRAKSV